MQFVFFYLDFVLVSRLRFSLFKYIVCVKKWNGRFELVSRKIWKVFVEFYALTNPPPLKFKKQINNSLNKVNYLAHPPKWNRPPGASTKVE